MQPLRRLLPVVAAVMSLGVMALAPLTSSADSPGSQTSDVRYGPILVPAATAGHPGEFAAVVPAIPMACTNCFLTGTKVDLVFEDGSSANLDNGLMLHHIVAFNAGRPDATCAPNTPIGSLGERFFAAGNERTGGTFPVPPLDLPHYHGTGVTPAVVGGPVAPGSAGEATVADTAKEVSSA